MNGKLGAVYSDTLQGRLEVARYRLGTVEELRKFGISEADIKTMVENGFVVEDFYIPPESLTEAQEYEAALDDAGIKETPSIIN